MIITGTLFGLVLTSLLLLIPKIFCWATRAVGIHLQKTGTVRKAQLIQILDQEEKEWVLMRKERRDSDEWENVEGYTIEPHHPTLKQTNEWNGIVGFFHPFCNAGGGGERVLWAAIRAIQKRWPQARCVVYTGDLEMDKTSILARVKNRFDINLHPPNIFFLYLTTRSWVLASNWPYFTLLGQSIGSLILAWDAFSLLVPDIFLDTMGYAFSLAFCRLLFPQIPTGAYVHYPTISTDMISSLSPSHLSSIQGVNYGKGVRMIGITKKIYWKIFAQVYSLAGGSIDVVMSNSSWTQNHIKSLWQPLRSKFNKTAPVVIYPPVAVEALVCAIKISPLEEQKRQPIILYLAQFREEKNHRLILRSYAKFKNTNTLASVDAKLVFVGSVRGTEDNLRVLKLKLLATELNIMDSVTFHLDASWLDILDWLSRSSIGVNGMWNEHFGIGVVEYQAAGLIPVVHKSGGPQQDIVRLIDGKPTGFHANTALEYSSCFELILNMSERDKLEIRERARKNAQRFSEDVFATAWIEQMERLVQLQKEFSLQRGPKMKYIIQ